MTDIGSLRQGRGITVIEVKDIDRCSRTVYSSSESLSYITYRYHNEIVSRPVFGPFVVIIKIYRIMTVRGK